MKIEEGKYYRTRSGHKVGPMEGETFKWIEGCEDETHPDWTNEGIHRNIGCGMSSADDLIAEWTEEPMGENIECRIKPGSKVEEATQYVEYEAGRLYFSLAPSHRITFDVVDGKPDCSSIKMEQL